MTKTFFPAQSTGKKYFWFRGSPGPSSAWKGWGGSLDPHSPTVQNQRSLGILVVAMVGAVVGFRAVAGAVVRAVAGRRVASAGAPHGAVVEEQAEVGLRAGGFFFHRHPLARCSLDRTPPQAPSPSPCPAIAVGGGGANFQTPKMSAFSRLPASSSPYPCSR